MFATVQNSYLTVHSCPYPQRLVVCFLLVLVCGYSSLAFALTVEELDPAKDWRLVELNFSGQVNFTEDELRGALTTKTRPWYTPWRAHPPFDPITFSTDLKRLTRFYQSHGYYEAKVAYELTPQPGEKKFTSDQGAEIEQALLSVLITVSEGEPVRVGQLALTLNGQAQHNGQHQDNQNASPPPADLAARATFETQLPTLRASLPLKEGDVFTEDNYQAAEAQLKTFFLEHGYGWTKVDRHAEVLLDQRTALLEYHIAPGPATVFGSTEIEGLEKVAPELVTREITYVPEERFSTGPLKATRKKIVDLGLFHSVQITPAKTQGHPRIVPMRIRVEERPPRDFKLGLGFGTEDQFRGQVEWHNRNWFGGGRRLSFLLKFSSITRSLGVQFVQPYFPTKHSRLVVDLTQGQEDEQTYLLNITRFRPRLEHHFSPTVSGVLGYRLEFAKLNGLSRSTIRGVGGLKREGILSGSTLGLIWNTTEDPFNPQQGSIVSLNLDQIGKFWGGDYQFYKITTEAKKYYNLGWQTVLAGRAKVSLADAFGNRTNLPIFERLYAGGERGVRGYGRRRLGPISSSDDPLGGLSLFEGSVELRRPVWQGLSGTLFFDFGQVETKAHDIPFDDLKFAAGFGVGYNTPLGPLQLYLGFPFDPPSGDSPWQVHFSVGQFF